MKIVLMSPPERDAYAPMLALPTLTAYLRERGFEVVQRDIGCELLDFFLTKKELENLYDYCIDRFEYLDKKESLHWEEQVEYLRYLSQNFNKFQYYINNIDEFKSRVKDINNYYVNDEGEPVLANEWLVLNEIQSFIFKK